MVRSVVVLVSAALALIPLVAAASHSHYAFDAHHPIHLRQARADCRHIAVSKDDTSCQSVADRCGVTLKQFQSFNSKIDCTKLQVDQWVCCSSGTLPSKRPNQNADGSCFAAEVVPEMDCSKFADKYDVTLKEIDEWNKDTWRWTGCKGLQPGMRICMSKGKPPLPKQNSSIPCGLESVGNKECPLKACCGKWGYCGLTDDFCEVNKGGPPGTGCQSNCEKISSFDTVGATSSTYGRNIIGYYSNWAAHRSCNGIPNSVVPAVRPRDLDAMAFTHVVYSFAGVSRGDWRLTETQGDDKELIKELNDLRKKNPNLKTLWAVGGWAFNDPPTQDIFSLACSTAGNRAQFVKNIISQIREYDFDGIDLDWEYPGTERGGKEEDGKNFLEFMKELKKQIQASGRRMEVSFTAPASYWYLQQFPIVELQQYTDWINLMTYDIHGSWDIKFNTGVLPHTAIPEVNAAVNMFLKAGVSLNKINLGIGFYGRSFTLADPGCNVGGCPMSGPGIKGACTNGEGFLSYGEIDHLITTRGLKPEYNSTSQTMTLKYDNQWIGYENAETLATKMRYVLKRKMPGVLIWAVDLDKGNTLLSSVVGRSLAPILSDRDCLANGVWPRTSAGSTATAPCPGSKSGGPTMTRLCGGPNWGEPKDTLCGKSQQMLDAFGHCEL